ncbi:MAG: GAF domain-containing protein, partial [candidate division NC10 bacterium]|nr:GAF domain-containing protein [candidate division NC10 bacterium]
HHQQEISTAFDEFGNRTIWLISITLLLGIGIMFFSLREIQRKTNQIKEERDFSQTLIEAIGDGVVLFNLQEKIEFVNRRFAEMLRDDPDRILRVTWPQIFHPEDLPEAKRHSGGLLKMQPHTFEGRLIRSNRSVFPALITVAPRLGANGEILGGVAVLRDITERKEAERSIQRLARALEETDEIVIITDLEEKITYANKAAARTYGYSSQELVGRHVSLLRTLDDHLFLGPQIRAASLSQGWQGEVMNRRRNGEVFPILLTTSLVRDEKGEPVAIVGISRDISERKRIQEEILQRNRELASLNAITATVSRSLNLPETLWETMIKVMEAIDAEGCEIYIQEDGSRRPVQVVSLGMERDHWQQQTLPQIEPPWAKPMALGDQPIVINDLQRDGRYPSLLSQGFLAFASIPLQSKGTSLGVLNVARKKGDGFSPAEVELLMATGNQMGMFVENVRSFERERRRVEELSSLIEVVQAVNSSLDLQKVLETIVSMAARLMNAPVAGLMLLDEAKQELCWSATLGVPPEWIERVGNLRVGESISGLVVSTGGPLSIPEISQDSRFLFPELAERFGLHSFLGVPLMVRGKPIGELSVLTTEPRCFAEREIRLLSAMADQAALAIENARLFQETEKLARDNFRRYQEVSILNELGTAMRGHHELEKLVSIVLTGVTYGGGLGFNRAILFLTDERNQCLEGVMGMGPSSAEEASRIWSELEGKKHSLLELVQAIPTDSIARSEFNLLAKSLRIPLQPEAGIIARTALEKRSFQIREGGAGPGEIHEEFEGRLGARAFATVPVMAREKVIGVILVDNLYNGRPIWEEDLRFLEALANQAGMAIESARLYSRLEEMNRQLMESHRQIVQMERLAL